MEREKQKTNAAIEMYPAGTQNSLQFRVGFATGVDWADEHPKEGLWDAEKVIKWLQDNADLYIWYDEIEGEAGMTDDFIENLRKAMEEIQ